MNQSTKEKRNEEIINELRSRIVKIDYTEKPKKTNKMNATKVWEIAKKVSKNLADDSLQPANPARS